MSLPRSTASPHPFAGTGRAGFVITASVLVNCLPGVALLASNVTPGRGFAILSYYVGLGLTWGLLAIGVGHLVSTLEQRRLNGPAKLLRYAGAFLGYALVDMLARRTGMWLLPQFLPVRFAVEAQGALWRVRSMGT